jgi:predicted outer membrane protein
MCLFVASAKAQQNPPGYPTSPPPGVTVQKPIMPDQSLGVSVDRQIADMLAIDNRGEVAMAKLAEAKAEDPAVKQFAERMEQDHTKMLMDLRPFENAPLPGAGSENTSPVLSNGDIGPAPNTALAPGSAPAGRSTVAGTPSTPAAPGTAGTPTRAPLGTTPTPGSTPNSSTVPTPGGVAVPSALPGANPQPATTQNPAPANPPASAQGPQASWAQYMPANRGLDFLHVKQQIAQECLATARKHWDTMTMNDAEIAYIGQQIVAHENMIDASKVLRIYASPSLQALIDQGIKTAESHLSEAKDVMDGLAQGHTASASQTSAK